MNATHRLVPSDADGSLRTVLPRNVISVLISNPYKDNKMSKDLLNLRHFYF